jgi:hypothetical protein
MVSLTLSIPEEFKQKMDKFNWLNWSSIAREAFAKRMKQLEALEEFREGLEKSKLSDKDCLELGKKLKESMLESSKS